MKPETEIGQRFEEMLAKSFMPSSTQETGMQRLARLNKIGSDRQKRVKQPKAPAQPKP